MIKKYSDEATYTAAGVPTDESRVALVESTNDVKFDGLNVQVDIPEPGDAVYHNDSEAVFYKGGDQFNASKLPTAIQNNKIGVVTDIVGDYAVIINKDAANDKYADVCQYQLNAPTLDGAEHTQTIGLRLSVNYSANTNITFIHTSSCRNSW